VPPVPPRAPRSSAKQWCHIKTIGGICPTINQGCPTKGKTARKCPRCEIFVCRACNTCQNH
jgi:hypothetical protein